MERKLALFIWALILAAGSLFPAPAQAQSQNCSLNTGNNATYIFPVEVAGSFGGTALATGDVVYAYTTQGICVGSRTWQAGSANWITVWGDDEMTDEVDGMLVGESIRFQVYDASANVTYTNTSATYSEGNGSYAVNGINVFSAFGEGAGRFADLRVMLQGPYSAATHLMGAALVRDGFLPPAQPFSDAAYQNGPMKYAGSEAVSAGFFAAHPNVVDWVLVELRTSAEASSKAGQRAGFLLTDGRVVDLDGSSPISFNGLSGSAYYVVVRHRNHLPVMSASAVDFSSGTGAYDFTNAQNKAFGSYAMKELESSVFGLYAGDADGNGQIANSDTIIRWWPEIGTAGYRMGDFNLNGQVQNSDKFLYWWPNIGIGKQVP